MDLLEGLDDVDWPSLRHAYGPATDVPGLLRAIADGPDPALAVDDLGSAIYHQGGLFPAAVAALPFLTALAVTPAITVRNGVLELLGQIVAEANSVPSPGEAWSRAWTPALPRLLRLLGDDDASVRRKTTMTLSAATAEADEIVPALMGRLPAEPDRVMRLCLIVAVGELAGGCTVRTLPETLGRLRDLRADGDVQVRLAAEERSRGPCRPSVPTSARSSTRSARTTPRSGHRPHGWGRCPPNWRSTSAAERPARSAGRRA